MHSTSIQEVSIRWCYSLSSQERRGTMRIVFILCLEVRSRDFFAGEIFKACMAGVSFLASSQPHFRSFCRVSALEPQAPNINRNKPQKTAECPSAGARAPRLGCGGAQCFEH